MKVDSLAAAAAARGPPPSWIAPDRGFYYAQSLGEFYDGRGDSRASARQFSKKIYLRRQTPSLKCLGQLKLDFLGGHFQCSISIGEMLK
jgi:hypothetical protein